MIYPEQSYIAKNGTKVIYRHKKRKYDFNHVVFVFSGFGQDRPDHYNFANILDYCPADVVWVNDNFDNLFTYYLCINMDFKVADAVGDFIHSKVQELGVPWSNITFLGASKGGSAALYHGLKMNVQNVVACVPQIKIGSYLIDDLPFTAKTANHMMGQDYNQNQIRRLDNVILELLKKDTFLDRNIYILTSEYDEQYDKYLSHAFEDFKKYRNFNLMKTYSAFVRQHRDVTEHHAVLVLSIIYQLASEATPYFVQPINFFGSQPNSNPKPTGEPYVDLRVLKLIGDRLFIDGVALLRGYDVAEYSDLNYTLVLEDKQGVTTLPLAKGNQPYITKQLFDGKYLTIYDKAVFTTYQHKGVDLSVLAKGTYQLSVEIALKNSIKAIQAIKNERGLSDIQSGNYRVFVKDGAFYLSVL